MRVFVDSNIPMYVAGSAHPLRDPALRFLERVRAGEIEACTSTEVLQEILYRYSGLRRLDLAKQVYELFVQVCAVVFPVDLADTDRAKDIVCGGKGVSARDAVHAAVMLNREVTRVATFDAGFSAIAGIERVPLV